MPLSINGRAQLMRTRPLSIPVHFPSMQKIKNPVDTSISSKFNIKDSVAVATTNHINIMQLSPNTYVDNYQLKLSDRILVKNQIAQQENGVYIIENNGPVRSTDFNTDTIQPGALVIVENGSKNQQTQWILTTPDPQIGKNLHFTRFNAYVLPSASSTELGGVRIGSGLTIESDGTISAPIPVTYDVVDNNANGLMMVQDKIKLDSIEPQANAYVLPSASSTQLGGVRIGSGLTVDSTGTVSAPASVTYDVVDNNANGLMMVQDKIKLDSIEPQANAYVLPSASSTELGGVRIGSGLTIESDGTISAPESITYDVVDNNTNGLMMVQDKMKLDSIVIEDVYEKRKDSVSTMWVNLYSTVVSASGSFITIDDSDLVLGLFMTAAHSIITVINGIILYPKSILITNPLTKNFIKFDENYIKNNLYYDGKADVAIIRTNINLENKSIPIKLANNVKTGDQSIMIGNPLGINKNSYSSGCVRDVNFCGTDQPTDTILVTTSGFPGNSGSSILNNKGELIGMYTFGFLQTTISHTDPTQYVMTETFAGGVNLWTLKKILLKLVSLAKVNNSIKRNIYKNYIGINWTVTDAVYISESYYDELEFPNKGVVITNISKDSPFAKDVVDQNNNLFQLELYDLVLSATYEDNGVIVTIEFGDLDNQYSLGKLQYLYDIKYVELTVIKHKENIGNNASAPSKVKYELSSWINISEQYDIYLSGGAGSLTNNDINTTIIGPVKRLHYSV